MSDNPYVDRWAEDRKRRIESRKREDERVRAAVLALGIDEDGRYDLRVRYERRGRCSRDISTRIRTERGLRWSGRVGMGLIEFYVHRPAPDGPEYSRFIDPVNIIEVIPVDAAVPA